MSFQLLLQWHFLSLLCLLSLVLVKIQPSLSNPQYYRNCSLPFRCGGITAGFPFWGGVRRQICGHPNLELVCENDIATMKIGGAKYRVLAVDPNGQVLSIARQDYFDGLCPLSDTTIDKELFDISAGYEILKLLYGCPVNPEQFPCHLKDIISDTDGFLQTGGNNILPGCNKSVDVLVSKTFLPAAKWNKTALEEALERGFKVKWKLNPCDESCSSCGYGIDKKEICYCPDGQLSNSTGCPTSTAVQAPKGSQDSPGLSSSKRRGIYIGIAVSVVGMIVILAILRFVVRRRFWEKTTEDDQNVEAFIRNYGSLAPKRYNYFDVERMTKSFSYKLGQGGYGDVYKGQLPDGRLVAVKVLKKSKGNGEEFINEVASISRTSHVNIVNFLGFCYEKKKRALIYEFMPNGSLDKFTSDQESSCTKSKLEWRTMFQISVGIARGLDYLHRGCNIRIVHFDIKPHNILLDEDFCPKISDFGLAKQSKKKESIMSMLDARGTIGYIAPEVFCRTFGGVSHKSDVYSYGMMILEMVGGRKNVDARVSHSSEIYFPNSIYKHLEPGSDFQFHGVVTEEEKEMAKKMILVSLWCIQTNSSDRPSMTKVVELLEGSLENLQIPPKPTLSLPTISDKQSSSLSIELASEEESCIA